MNVRKKPASKTPVPKARVRKEIAEKKVPPEEMLPDLDIVAYAPKQALVTNQRHVLETHTLPYINKKYGAGTIMWLEDVPVLPRITTGVAHLDEILDGGIETGGIVMVYGLDKCGKTSLALQIAGAQDDGVVYMDGENKVTMAQAKRYGAHGNYAVSHPQTIEYAYEIARTNIKAGIKLVVLDSLPSFPSIKELEQKDFDKPAGVAAVAGLNGRKLGVLNNLCYEHHATMLIVNQLRPNMNVTNQYATEKYHVLGGEMLKGITKLQIRCARSEFIKVEEKVGRKIEKKEIGQTLRYQIVSASFCPPRGTGEICILYRGKPMRLHSEVGDEAEFIEVDAPEEKDTPYTSQSVRIQEVTEFTEGVTDDSGEPNM